MTREELNKEISSVIKSNTNIALQACTGAGKTKCSLDIATKIKAKKVLVLIAERAHLDNWAREIEKWKFKVPELKIICYSSMHKLVDSNWDIIIYDEAHHLGSELRLSYFEKIHSKYKVFLSATLKDKLLYTLQESCGYIKTITVGLQDAFNSKLLPEPKIILVPLTLNSKDVNRCIVEEWGKKDKRVTIYCSYRERWTYLRSKKRFPNVKLVISCTEQQEYDYLSEQFEYYKKTYFSTRSEAVKNKWLQCGSKRKLLLGILKTDYAQKVLELVRDKRFICFCTNIAQADYLGGEQSIHSKKSEKVREELINNFNNLKIDSLYAVGMLQEGMNLNNIEAGIIVQLDGEERAFIQKFGKLVLPVCI